MISQLLGIPASGAGQQGLANGLASGTLSGCLSGTMGYSQMTIVKALQIILDKRDFLIFPFPTTAQVTDTHQVENGTVYAKGQNSWTVSGTPMLKQAQAYLDNLQN